MDAVRVGIVGMGFMGEKYARIVWRIAEAELVGVCDNDPSRAAAAGAAFETPAYQTTEELLERTQPRLLCVCGPEDYHLEPSLLALDRGVGVLVEKPLAPTVDDARRIHEAARRGGAFLSVGHLLRYDTRYSLAKDAIDAGRIGAVQSLHARRWNTRSAQARLRGRSSLPLFLGVHDYDIVRWFAGAEPVRVYAESRGRVLKEVGYAIEDTSIALISFANDVVAVVEEGWIMPEGHPSGFEQRLDVLGATGMASVEGGYAGLTIVDDTQEQWPDTMMWPAGADGSVAGALERELRDVITRVGTGSPPLVSGEDGLAAVRIAAAVEESASRQAPVTL